MNEGGDEVQAGYNYEDNPEHWGYLSHGDSASRGCEHRWVNVSFAHLRLACKHCGVDAPAGAKEYKDE